MVIKAIPPARYKEKEIPLSLSSLVVDYQQRPYDLSDDFTVKTAGFNYFDFYLFAHIWYRKFSELIIQHHSKKMMRA